MTAESAPVAVTTGRVLFLDDHPEPLTAFLQLLGREGFDCEVANNVETAWDLAIKGTFDVAFIDIMMGDRPLGYALISRLRNDPRTKNLPIVAMTGFGPEHMEEAKKLGADAVFNKLDFREKAAPLAYKLIAERPASSGDILYLEDDEGWAGLVRAWLTEAGMRVRRVASRKQFMEALAHSRSLPDLVLLDLLLDGDDGLAALADLKSTPAYQSIPVIVFTSRPDVRVACCRLGAVNVVSKTDSQAELLAVLSAALGQHQRSRGVVELDDLRLDPRNGLVFLDGKAVATLQPRPFALLRTLVLSSPDVVPEDYLLASVARRQRDARGALTHSRSLDTYISELRHAAGPRIARRIRCEKGFGYRYFGKL